MNLKVFNESFSKYYTESADIIETDTSFLQELKNALEGDVRYLKEVRQTNPMLQAYKLQATIEELVPDKSWWEVTDCNINGELGNGLPLDKIVDCIIDNLKPEYTNTNESIKGSVNDYKQVSKELFNSLKPYGAIKLTNNVDTMDIAFDPAITGNDSTLIYHDICSEGFEEINSFDGEPNVTEFVDKKTGTVCVKLLVYRDSISVEVSQEQDNESLNEARSTAIIYDEPEMLGKGYVAPTSIDYADEVKYKLKYNALEDLQNLQELMNATIARVEDFDEYWNAHKAAIMKNIKEAQDLIPTEYRA